MRDIEQHAEIERLKQHKQMVHEALTELGIGEYETEDCRIKFRLQELRELIERLKGFQPVAGPPELDGVPDDWEMRIWLDSGKYSIQLTRKQYDMECWADNAHRIAFHIGPFPVRLPPPSQPLPKCPWCGSEMEPLPDISMGGKVENLPWRACCADSNCNAQGPLRDTEAAAIQAARKDGE